MDSQQLQQYEALKQGRGFVWLEDRCMLRFSGPDASKFLHSFCTANVNDLDFGFAAEAFVLDTRGKILSFGHLLKFDQTIYWAAANKLHASSLRGHFDKYIIREDVVVDDVSDHWRTAIRLVAKGRGVDGNDLNRVFENEFGMQGCLEIAGLSQVFFVDAEKGTQPDALAGDASVEECSVDALNMLRLERGTPWFGAEVSNENLPQELRRDEKAISFTKGCYLGQETVAKIDAIGQVNKFLVGIRLENGEVRTGELVMDDEQKIGEMKSICYSPEIDSMLGLAYVKRKFAEPGRQVRVAGESAEVVSLPVTNGDAD